MFGREMTRRARRAVVACTVAVVAVTVGAAVWLVVGSDEDLGDQMGRPAGWLRT